MRLGITGFPLLYTKSPRLHRGFLRAASRKGSYEVLPFDPNCGKREFFRFLDDIREKGYRGLNVTIPHKEWAYEYAAARGGVAPGLHGRSARLVRAANTLIFGTGGTGENRRVLAANTDAAGLWDDLAAWLPRRLRAGFELVVVGTGGAARGALAGALAGHKLGARALKISVWGRDTGKAKKLLKLVPASRRADSRKRACPVVVLWCLAPLDPPSARLIWNGIAGPREGREVFLYDLNYDGRADATKELGSRLRRRSGRGMLERQAAFSFALWAK